MTRAAKPLLIVLCAALTGCGDGSDQGIEYSSMDKTLGRWPAKSQQTAKPSMVTLSPDASTTDEPTDSGAAAAASGDAGADDPSAVMPSAGTSGSVKPPIQSKPPQTTDAGQARPARLRFSVLTEVQHMRLSKSEEGFDEDARGPKNMGAIWISKPDGTFVRSLEVWRLHKDRARHLVGFNKVCQCPKPDVVATATLNKHREHVASWDMSDRDGAQVPEGNYTLHIEVADYDVDNADRLNTTATNAQLSVDFDTHSGPSQLTPAASQYFANLKLELLAP